MMKKPEKKVWRWLLVALNTVLVVLLRPTELTLVIDLLEILLGLQIVYLLPVAHNMKGRLACLALLVAAAGVTWLLYANGSQVLMDYLDSFVLLIFVCALLLVRTCGGERYFGLIFLLLGVALLMLLFLYGLTPFNRLMHIPFLFILVGAVLHVRHIKRESRY